MTVYVLHIDPPYRHARHYIGFTPDATADRRIAEHLAGTGSPLIRAARAAGCTIQVAEVFAGAPRLFERNLKRRRDTASWCHLCARFRRRTPDPAALTPEFLAAKPEYPAT